MKLFFAILSLTLTQAFGAIGQCSCPCMKDECRFNAEGRHGKYPPLVTKGGNFAYPTVEEGDNRYVIVESGDQLTFLCHPTDYYDTPSNLQLGSASSTSTGDSSISVTCEGDTFKYNGKTIDLSTLTCSLKNEPSHVQEFNSTCAQENADGTTNHVGLITHVDIGWTIEDNFVRQIELCVDESQYATLWTRHDVVGPSINIRDMESGRPSFRVDNTGRRSKDKRNFFHFTTSTGMNEFYSKKECANTMVELLGSNTMDGHDIIETSTSGTHYFAKGHLAPDAAFIYSVQQDGTYYFTNVAPQFQSFNNGNWKALEMNVRSYANRIQKTLDIWTGTYGMLSYKNVDINLYNSGDKHFVPAPKYYWKVIHNPDQGTALAFIGLNDPYAAEPYESMCGGNSICDQYPEIVSWKYNNNGAGYMECCELKHLKVPYVPKLDVNILRDE